MKTIRLPIAMIVIILFTDENVNPISIAMISINIIKTIVASPGKRNSRILKNFLCARRYVFTVSFHNTFRTFLCLFFCINLKIRRKNIGFFSFFLLFFNFYFYLWYLFFKQSQCLLFEVFHFLHFGMYAIYFESE